MSHHSVHSGYGKNHKAKQTPNIPKSSNDSFLQTLSLVAASLSAAITISWKLWLFSVDAGSTGSSTAEAPQAPMEKAWPQAPPKWWFSWRQGPEFLPHMFSSLFIRPVVYSNDTAIILIYRKTLNSTHA